MPQTRNIDNFERTTRRKVYVRENGCLNIEYNFDGPEETRSLEQIMRDNRIAKALINSAKRAEVQRKQVEKRIAFENEQQKKREQEAEALQRQIREGVAVQTAAMKRRESANMAKVREKHEQMLRKLSREKRVLKSKIDKIKRSYATRLNRLNCDLDEARRPAIELQKKWTGKFDSDLEFNGIHPHGAYMANIYIIYFSLITSLAMINTIRSFSSIAKK